MIPGMWSVLGAARARVVRAYRVCALLARARVVPAVHPATRPPRQWGPLPLAELRREAETPTAPTAPTPRAHKQRAQPLPSGPRWNRSSTVRYVQRWTACDPPHASGGVGWRYGCFGMRSVAKSTDGAEMAGRCALSLLT
eukprot:COSAG06_NODE_1770_length_8429_cov_5.051981_3_plen_140_part_00